MHKQLSWDGLQLVLAVGREGSLSGAARALGVRHSTVFRRLRALERDMGVRFFDRSVQGYVATPAGEAAVTLATRVADDVLALERALAGQDLRPSGLVRLTTTDTLALSVVMPHVTALRSTHPEIRIEVAVSNVMANLTRREADIAIRPIPEPPPTLIGRRVSDIAYAVYASPRYLSHHPARELSDFDWIGWDDALADSAGGRWMREHVAEECIGLRADSLTAMREAARSGLGATLLPCYFGDRVPGLKRVRRETIKELKSRLWLLTHEDLRRTARIRAVMDFLAGTLVRERPLLEGMLG